MLSKILLFCSFLIFCKPCVWAQSILHKLDSAHSQITFKSESSALPLSGKFTSYSGQVAINPQTQELQQVAFNIDLSESKFDRSTSQHFEWIVQGLVQGLASSVAHFKSTTVQRVSADSAKAVGVVSVGTQRHALTIPIKIIKISKKVSQFQGMLNGSVTPSELPNALQGEMKFDLLFKEGS